VHVGQFACAAVMLAGLVALPFAIGADNARARWAGRFGAVSAGVALALYGVLQAVDGIGNKEVDDAGAGGPAAPPAELRGSGDKPN
jgi:hypothetical protein